MRFLKWSIVDDFCQKGLACPKTVEVVLLLREAKMSIKHNFCFCCYILAFVLLPGWLPTAIAVTTDELAAICEKMESAINDVSLEYNWYNIPPWTFEELAKEGMGKVLLPKDGCRRFKLSAAHLSIADNINDSNSPLTDRLLWEESTTFVTADGNSWDNVEKSSYDGHVFKRLNTGGWPPTKSHDGMVSQSGRLMPSLMLSPIGFTVSRFRMNNVDGGLPLSAYLTKHKDSVRVDNTISKINKFDTIRADFLQWSTKQVCLRIYFSVDHDYTPIRYEYMNGNRGVIITMDVDSLEQVAEGLWFPSSGHTSRPNDTHIDAYIITGKIVINQGFTDKDFDIDFPPGTKVLDEINNQEYNVRPSQEQLEEALQDITK